PAAGRVMPSFDAVSDISSKAPGTTPMASDSQRGWQAPASPSATAPAPAAVPDNSPALTLPLKPADARISQPPNIDAPKVLPVPSTDLGDRYRDSDRYRDNDRYRDYAPPAAAQPKAAPPTSPTDSKDDRAADKSPKINERSLEKAPTPELVGPVLPP